jgi:hypothetical protein
VNRDAGLLHERDARGGGKTSFPVDKKQLLNMQKGEETPEINFHELAPSTAFPESISRCSFDFSPPLFFLV